MISKNIIYRTDKTGKKIRIEYYFLQNNPKLKHNENDFPAEIVYDEESDKIIRKIWFKNGEIHRSNLPAYISNYPNGKIRIAIWYNKDWTIRKDDLPTVKFYYDNGQIHSSEWIVTNSPSRIQYARCNSNLPTCIKYHENGNKACEKYIYGKETFNREGDLPAEIYWFSNGNKRIEKWYIKGKLHRENDQPAIIEYFEDGQIKSKNWYFEGEAYIPENYLELL